MSALSILREIKLAARRIGFKKKIEHVDTATADELVSNITLDAVVPIQWGNYDYIKSIGVNKMSRRELRNHLEARDLSSQGTRTELIERLKSSLAEEEHRSFTKVETMINSENMAQSDIEERGSVYVCGSNTKGELGIGTTIDSSASITATS
jgi:hypothetical protein